MSDQTLNCAETFRRLDDYVDRELSAEELATVERHLERCAMCSGEFAVERELLERVRSRLISIRMPPHLMAKIARRLRQV